MRVFSFNKVLHYNITRWLANDKMRDAKNFDLYLTPSWPYAIVHFPFFVVLVETRDGAPPYMD
jgi:hypothetical protein